MEWERACSQQNRLTGNPPKGGSQEAESGEHEPRSLGQERQVLQLSIEGAEVLKGDPLSLPRRLVLL